jgi:hypothetical protein
MTHHFGLRSGCVLKRGRLRDVISNYQVSSNPLTVVLKVGRNVGAPPSTLGLHQKAAISWVVGRAM